MGFSKGVTFRDSCLLLKGDNNQELSVHDVICDIAISIACRLVRNEDVWEWPDDIAPKACYAISLIDCSIHELPEGCLNFYISILRIIFLKSIILITFSQGRGSIEL